MFVEEVLLTHLGLPVECHRFLDPLLDVLDLLDLLDQGATPCYPCYWHVSPDVVLGLFELMEDLSG